MYFNRRNVSSSLEWRVALLRVTGVKIKLSLYIYVKLFLAKTSMILSRNAFKLVKALNPLVLFLQYSIGLYNTRN